MVASVGRITAGRGYDYLTREVATSKHDYYTGKGEAPGVWSGRGCALIGLSGEVAAEDMAVLYGRFVLPSTAGGTRLASGRWLPEQVLGRKVVAKTRADGSVADPIAAFDVTFSPSKSVSVLWGLTDDLAVRRIVEEAHDKAVAAGLGYLDQTAGHTRAGDGGVRKVPGEGFIIAQFRHRTSRSTDPVNRVGDPQLHTHCAILNRIRGTDGTWRTLDSRAIYRNAHAAGAVYGAVLERELSQRLGVSWVTPDRRVPMREIAGIPQRLLARFSTRRAAVLETYEQLLAEWRAVHGRTPTHDEAANMKDEATTRSRHRKARGDVEVHGTWRAEVPDDELAALAAVTVRGGEAADGGRLQAGSPQLTERVFTELHEQRAWWTRAHVTGEVARHMADPTPEAIEVETERIVALCVPLEVDDDVEYADVGAAKYTSATIQTAEQRVLTSASKERAAFAVETARDPMLGDDQLAAVDEIAGGGGRVVTIIGPAGAGKTTMLRSVAASYQAAGRDVIVLTVAAAAARVVTEETGLAAETIAGWRVGTVDMPRNGVVIVDEASMVPTLVLDEMVRVAGVYGSKITLIGDFAQMGAPEAGGLLRDLASLPAAVELTAVRRFRESWEADASLQLRARQPDVAATYLREGRIVESTTHTVFDDAAAAWWADTAEGRRALIVVDTGSDAADVNSRCQEHLMVAGHLGEHVADDADGCRIHIGDLVQSRLNTSDITTSDHRRILNRDVWTVTGIGADGSLHVHHALRLASAVLPASYVERSVVLGYATTIAGAQGRTVDRGHVVVTPRTISASLYVGMSRGREANHAHVVCDSHDHAEFELGDLTGEQAFAAATQREPDGQLSAHTVQQRWEAGRVDRTTARSADRMRRQITDWWTKRQLNLPPALLAAIAGCHHQILDVLHQVPDPTRREEAIRTAASGITWSQPDAAARFLHRLQLTAAPNSGPNQPSPVHQHTVDHQR
jgi:conjugative relaxase-like TrwC/TraI family protein